MWLSLFGFITGTAVTYFALMIRRSSRKPETLPCVESPATSQTEKPSSPQSVKPIPAKTTSFSRVKDALNAISKWAELVKRILQYLIGFSIVTILIIQILFLIERWTFTSKLLEEDAANLLKIVAVGLIVSTAVELAYMLFTDGPDEAIDPVITALAAILLLRMPSPTLEEEIAYTRIIEMLVYGFIIVFMFWVRELYLNGKIKREQLEKDAKTNE